MAGTNDFLPVATQGTPNVQSQVAYAASLVQQQGWADDGIPPANIWNKMLRQATSIAAVVAQAMANITGQNILDDGNTTAKVALFTSMFRIQLNASTTFYLNHATGSDSTGDGSSGNPWQTLPHAIAVFQAVYDFGGQAVTVQLADGTYTETVNMNGGIPGLTQPNNLKINGNSGTPTNVVYTSPISASYAGAMFAVDNFEMSGTYGVESSYGGTVIVGAGMRWGAMSGYHIYGNTRGNILIQGNYNIIGNALAHISMLGGSICAFSGGLTINVAGGLTINSFVIADTLSEVTGDISTHFTGSTPTGNSCTITAGSLVSVPGGTTSYFPGTGNNIATGGQFVT